MARSLTRECRLIAFGYGCLGLIYVPIIVAMCYISVSRGLSIFDFIKSISRTLVYLLVVSSINIFMAIAVWRIFSLSKKVQRAIFGFAVLLSILAVIIFISTIALWRINDMPGWYNSLYRLLQNAVLTFCYCYYAFALNKMMKFYNNHSETTDKLG